MTLQYFYNAYKNGLHHVSFLVTFWKLHALDKAAEILK